MSKLGPTLISRSLIFIIGYNNSEMEKKVNPQFIIQHEIIRSAQIFILLVKEGSGERRFHNFIRNVFVVVRLAVQNSLVFRDGSLELVGKVRFVRIQSIRVVNLLIADVHFNI